MRRRSATLRFKLVVAITGVALTWVLAAAPASAEVQFLDKWGTQGDTGAPGVLEQVAGLSVDAAGNVSVADVAFPQIQTFTSTGNHVRSFGGPFGAAEGEFKG